MQQSSSTVLWSDVGSRSALGEGQFALLPVSVAPTPDTNNPIVQPVVILFFVNRVKMEEIRPFVEHNYLRYFRKIYESKGWTTFQCTPTDDVTGKERTYEQTVQSVMALVESYGLHQSPIFLHILGYQSVALYNQFTKAVDMEAADVFRIHGTIVDSGPSRPTGLVAYIRKTLPAIYSLAIILLHILAAIFSELFTPPKDFDDFEQFCYNTCPSPQLYLYSTSDHLVDQKDVETAINIRHRAGVVVDKRCWPDTEHARHLFTHEEEYTTLCQNFVEKNSRSK